jgi:hypothetical protein
MFTVKLFDINNQELKIGDLVKIRTGRKSIFYCKIKFIAEGILAPFHTFSFMTIEKVDSIPDNAIPAKEDRYNVWFLADDDEQTDITNEYLLSWRQCETLLNSWKIYS